MEYCARWAVHALRSDNLCLFQLNGTKVNVDLFIVINQINFKILKQQVCLQVFQYFFIGLLLHTIFGNGTIIMKLSK
jgi:hypothetical protein